MRPASEAAAKPDLGEEKDGEHQAGTNGQPDGERGADQGGQVASNFCRMAGTEAVRPGIGLGGNLHDRPLVVLAHRSEPPAPNPCWIQKHEELRRATLFGGRRWTLACPQSGGVEVNCGDKMAAASMAACGRCSDVVFACTPEDTHEPPDRDRRGRFLHP
jgi:hypothetical protein